MKKVLFAILMLTVITGLVLPGLADGERKARVIAVKGEVSVMVSGAKEPVEVAEGMLLSSGDVVKTGRKAYVEMAFDKEGGNIVKLQGKSEAIILISNEDKLELVRGELITFLKNLEKGETFRIKTPAAACGARGTGWQMKTDGKTMSLAVFDGVVFVRGIDKDGKLSRTEYLIEKGFKTKVARFEGPEKKRRISERTIKKLRKEIKLPKAILEKRREKTLDEARVEFHEKRLAKRMTTIENKVENMALSVTRRDVGYADKLMPATEMPMKMQPMEMHSNMMMKNSLKDRIEDTKQVQRENLMDAKRQDFIDRLNREDGPTTTSDDDGNNAVINSNQ